MSDEELAAAQTTRLEGIVEAVIEGFGIDASSTVAEDDEGGFNVSIDGDGAGVLVEGGGEVVDAIQHVASHAVGRVEGAPRRRVSVDADGYRARREAALERLAERAAAEAIEHTEEIELDAMTPQDRRVVHMALRDREGIVTRSEGEEPKRRVIVEPAD